jgi:hypothetical protein
VSSFPEGTEVLTPNGRVAIESLREGDLVIARDEDNGVSGVFPVTALISRTAAEVIWLTLENEAGQTTRMGVTSEHPLFVVDDGWTDAKEVVVGDLIRDAELLPLTVLAVEIDATPTRVHNLEIADAHTYFAGELEAWGHNSRRPTKSTKDAVNQRDGCNCVYCGTETDPTAGSPNSREYDHYWPYSDGGGGVRLLSPYGMPKPPPISKTRIE